MLEDSWLNICISKRHLPKTPKFAWLRHPKRSFLSGCGGFKVAYYLGLSTLFAMALNVVALVVCLFLIAQYLEGTLHKGMYLGAWCFCLRFWGLGAWPSFCGWFFLLKRLEPRTMVNLFFGKETEGLRILARGMIVDFHCQSKPAEKFGLTQ